MKMWYNIVWEKIMAYINKEDEKKYHKEYYINHKKEYARRGRQYYINNRDKVLEQGKLRHLKNKERRKQYYQSHKKEICEKRKVYREKNREEINGKLREYHQNNKKLSKERSEKYKKRRNTLLRNRRKTDLKFNLNSKMSNMICYSLKGNKNGRHWESLVGYTSNDLIKRLKKTMPDGFTWQDFLEGKLHIDHIIPKSVFNFTKPKHIGFKRCWALSNLQLLPMKENLTKANKLSKPFQPCLKISPLFNLLVSIL